MIEAAWHSAESYTPHVVKKDLTQVCSVQFIVLAAISTTTTTTTGITPPILLLLKPGATLLA